MKYCTILKIILHIHTGMLDINERASILQNQTLWMQLHTCMSVLQILCLVQFGLLQLIGIFAALKRKKDQLNKTDE